MTWQLKLWFLSSVVVSLYWLLSSERLGRTTEEITELSIKRWEESKKK